MVAKLKVAVITGGHPFPVPAFRALFESMVDFDIYHQDLDNFARGRRDDTFDMYEAFVFYNMHYWGLLSVRKDMGEAIPDALKALGDSKAGILVWHHALLSYPEMPGLEVWGEITKLERRRLQGCRQSDMNTRVVDNSHPITQGLSDWTMPDEFFKLDEPGPGSHTLLTTDHPESMSTLGWVHQHKNARVFCYQSGHTAVAYGNDNFRAVLTRGIDWVGNRL